MPGVWAPLDANTTRAASASHARLAMSRRRRSNLRFGSLSAHVASLCCISLIIKGLHLIRSGSLHSKQFELSPFAMWQAFPCRGLLRELRQHDGRQGQLPCDAEHRGHSIMPSLVHMLDFHALGRLPVAVLVLASRKSMPMPWPGCILAMAPYGQPTCLPAFGCRRHTCPATSSAFRLSSRVGEGDISALGCVTGVEARAFRLLRR